MKKIVLLSAVLFLPFFTIAQNDIDAMRFSQLTFGGTARFVSMGGSMGALGGDISTLSFNPAGIAVYRKSELSITPSFYVGKSSSTYSDESAGDRKLNFNLGNIGLVATYKVKDTARLGWHTLHFGIGYNRTNNFHNRYSVQGYNRSSSLLDTYVNNANGNDPEDFDQFSTGLAWSTYLIDTNSALGANQYEHPINNYGQLQRRSIESRGSMGETALSFGGNYKNRILLGATIGLVNARYIEESVYEEVDEGDSIDNFNSFTYINNLDSKGSGINLKLGVIVKATDWLRLGAAVHTPTALYDVQDNYSSSMRSDLEGGQTYEDQSPKGHFDYSVSTPFRAIGSIGFIIQKFGLINAEYEYIDYSSAQLSSSPNVFAEVNSTIRNKYTSTGNFRIGAEGRLDPVTFRAGYALYGSPFKTGENRNASRSSYCAGIGFRDKSYFIDMAYVMTRYEEETFLYDPEISNPVQNKITTSSFMLTLGVRF